MPIAQYDPLAPSVVEPNVPQIEPNNYKSIITNDDQTPILSLVSYASGAPWSVNYYSQIVSKHNNLRELDVAQPSIYQQYQLINNLELRVTSPLTPSYDEATSITTVTGSANLYSFILPNVNDYFVTDTNDSRQGLFKITTIERKSYNKASIYEITYVMIGYVDALTELYQDLKAKVIRNYYFSKERLLAGQQPILRDSDYQQLTDLNLLYKELIRYYFKTFFNRRFMTLVLPGQSHQIYDSFVVNYLLKLVESIDADEVRLIKAITTDLEPYLAQDQLFSLLARKDYTALSYANNKMGIVSKLNFGANSSLHGLYYSNIEYLIYPITADQSTLVKELPSIKELTDYPLDSTTGANGSNINLLEDLYVINEVNHPLVYPILVDDYYVLSANFYQDTTDKSVLEILTKDYLKRQTLDKTMLLALANRYKSWQRLEQFYYGPILLTLIKEAQRAVYS